MPEGEQRAGGGVAFFMSWHRLGRKLRGMDNEFPEIKTDETAEFVICERGVTVYVEKV